MINSVCKSCLEYPIINCAIVTIVTMIKIFHILTHVSVIKFLHKYLYF